MPQALLPVLSKSVGKTCAVPRAARSSRLAAGTPLSAYCAGSAFIGLRPTVKSLAADEQVDLLRGDAGLRVDRAARRSSRSMSACIVASMPALPMVALYMHAV